VDVDHAKLWERPIAEISGDPHIEAQQDGCREPAQSGHEEQGRPEFFKHEGYNFRK
jgi:hypothetical protein